MHVQIVLEAPYSVYTNLDFIRGKVILRLQSVTLLSSINVKLEGEARTRLMSPGNKEGGERPRPVEETHKVLYKLVSLLQKELNETLYATHTQYHALQPGNHEWPFQFKLPFNNACNSSTTVNNLTFGALSLGVARAPARHVRATLPPTLTAFPGMCEIRYYLKVTVNRKEFYKENPRVYQPFNFIPIEPPRPAASTSENYARRQHQFPAGFMAGSSKMKSIFNASKEKAPMPASPIRDAGTPRISLDARIPEPAILTCNQDVPLRLLVKRLNENSDWLYLQSLHIDLVGHTAIRAQDVFRNETNSWIIVSQSNMNILLDSGTDPEKERMEKEIVIDSVIWRGKPVPNTVAPSFDTCNISRRYELEIRVGIGYGSASTKNAVILPLKLPISVFSGIKPPAALLNAMQQTATGRPSTSSVKPPIPGTSMPVRKKPVPAQINSNVAGTSQVVQSPSQPQPQPQPHTAFAPLPIGEEEPPPTYEEAIGDTMAPIDGPRDYQPPPVASGGFPVDEKR